MAERVCRVCLAGQGQGAQVAEPELQRKLSFACRDLQNIMSDPNESLPNRICSECSQNINTLYNFCNLALNSYNTLTSYLNSGLEDLQNFYESLLSESEIKIKTEIVEVSHYKDENLDEDYEVKCDIKRDNLMEVKSEPEIYNSDKEAYSSDDDPLSALQAEKNLLGTQQMPRKTTKCHRYEMGVLRSEVKKEDYKETKKDARSWKCLTCPRTFKSRKSLKFHYNKEHADKESKQEVVRDENGPVGYVKITNENNEVKYQCLKCDRIIHPTSVSRHTLTHTEVRPFDCNLCGRQFKSVTDILLHGRAHSDDNTLFCDHCNYSTVYPHWLIRHMKMHAARKFRHICKVCKKGFDALSQFREHMKVHSDDRLFGCDECGKKFHIAAHLRAHMVRAHPYAANACMECGKRFRTRKNLNRHQKTNHRRSFLCDHCGKELSSQDHLRLHVKIHLGIKSHACGVCGKAFVSKKVLTEHERIHTGVKPYVCVTCGRGFSQRSPLVTHMRSHTGSRPFKCVCCSKAFVTRGLLTVHQKTCC